MTNEQPTPAVSETTMAKGPSFWSQFLDVYRRNPGKFSCVTLALLSIIATACGIGVPSMPDNPVGAAGNAAATVQARLEKTVVPKIQADATTAAEMSQDVAEGAGEFIQEAGKTIQIITPEIQAQIARFYAKATEAMKQRLDTFNSLTPEQRNSNVIANLTRVKDKLRKTPLSRGQTIEDGTGEIIDMMMIIQNADLTPQERLATIQKILPLVAQANNPSQKLSLFLCYNPSVKRFRVNVFEFGRPDLFSADGTCMNIESGLRAKQRQLQEQINALTQLKTRTPPPTPKP